MSPSRTLFLAIVLTMFACSTEPGARVHNVGAGLDTNPPDRDSDLDRDADSDSGETDIRDTAEPPDAVAETDADVGEEEVGDAIDADAIDAEPDGAQADVLDVADVLPPDLDVHPGSDADVSSDADAEVGPEPRTRGAWFWGSGSDPYGLNQTVDFPDRHAGAFALMREWEMGRCYASLSDRPVRTPEVTASWNRGLHEAGIEVYLLTGDSSWIEEGERDGLMNRLRDRLVGFNEGRASEEQFDGMHLDIEPHADPTWSDADGEEKYRRLELLADTMAAARAELDRLGAEGLPIYLDLPVWFDSLDGSIAWPSEGVRDAWYRDRLGSSLAGISMMAFERDVDRVVSSTETERRLFPGEVRLGLEVDLPASWSSLIELAEAAAELEALGFMVDFQSFNALAAESDR